MEKFSKNSEVDQEKVENEPQLCKMCYEFYGDPAKEHLCSKCFKEKNIAETPKNSTFSSSSLEEEQKAEKKEELISEESTKTKQEDNSKCWKCSRKTGLLGYQCKCSYTFCKLHRLPEYHECSYDYVSEGRKKLNEANPVVKGSKMQKI